MRELGVYPSCGIPTKGDEENFFKEELEESSIAGGDWKVVDTADDVDEIVRDSPVTVASPFVNNDESLPDAPQRGVELTSLANPSPKRMTRPKVYSFSKQLGIVAGYST